MHEAYLRLVDVDQQQKWNSRGHFFCAAARGHAAGILVENARRKRSLKRGGGLARKELDDSGLALPELKHDLLALDEALTKLAEEEPVKARLVELRFFCRNDGGRSRPGTGNLGHNCQTLLALRTSVASSTDCRMTQFRILGKSLIPSAVQISHFMMNAL